MTYLIPRIKALEDKITMLNKQYLSETQELGAIITQLTQRVKKLEIEPRIVVYKRGVGG